MQPPITDLLEFSGERELISRPRCALLVSRAERNPNPDAPWLRATIAAAKSIAESGETLVCGAGRLAWDCALLSSRRANGTALIVLEAPPSEVELSELKLIVPNHSLFVWPKHDVPRIERKTFRDQLVGQLADRAIAVHVRENGNMAAVVAELKARGCSVESLELPETERAAKVPTANANLNLVDSAQLENRLTHFTRGADGAWPGESHSDYLGWLSSDEDFEPRDGFHALRRILSQRRILACPRLIPGKVPMVCFTAAQPQSVLDQATYRKGLRRWTLSPYALSLPRSAFRELHARPVHYVSGPRPDDDDACFTQPANSDDNRWEHEDEWRLRGDFDFSKLNVSQIMALVPTQTEAAILAREFGVRIGLLNSRRDRI